jgi:hypothetical protein
MQKRAQLLDNLGEQTTVTTIKYSPATAGGFHGTSPGTTRATARTVFVGDVDHAL